MIVLNGAGLPTLLRYRDSVEHATAHLGRLARPRHISRLRDTLQAGFVTGIDNDCFSAWDMPRFVRQLHVIDRAVFGGDPSWCQRIRPWARDWPLPGPPPRELPAVHPNLKFVVVPDVPFDARATLARFFQWAPMMSHLPLAFCLQDGAHTAGVPWHWPGLRCLFMAGSTSYKLSADMTALCREGKARGLWIHCGRVNTTRRIRQLHDHGCVDSIDGSGLDRFRDQRLPAALAAAAERGR